MKTTFSFLRNFLFCAILATALSCSKSSPVVATSCEKNAEKVTNAATAFSSDPTNVSKCEAYKTAVNDFYKSCPTFYTGTTKDALDEFLKTPCPQ